MKPQPKNPFVGLKSFDANDYLNFYGRDEDIKSLYFKINEILADNSLLPIVIVHGSSGVGKSSLLKAGLLPSLVTDSHYNNYSVISIVPNLNPTNNLINALSSFIRKKGLSLHSQNQVEEILNQKNKNGLKDLLKKYFQRKTMV